MKTVAGIDSLNIPELFATATRRIILHAAVYGPFADSEPHCNGLATALSRTTFEKLDIIAVTPDADKAWASDFFKTLRLDQTPSEIEEEVQASLKFLRSLEVSQPTKVCIHPVISRPNLPIIIADDTIVFGQYARADRYAPQGFWSVVEADVEKLMQWATEESIPTTATSAELAAYRLVSECVHAMRHNPEHL